MPSIKTKFFLIFLFLTTILIVLFLRKNFINKKNYKELLLKTTMQITSPAFIQKDSIPTIYTCNGKDIIPPLIFSEIPKEAKSLTLIIDDPDATLSGGWDHYIAWNISPNTTRIREGIEPDAVKGKNSWGKTGYKGPCPPEEHRYYFKLFALDTLLNLREGSTKKELLESMQNHVLEEAEIFGKYQQK